MDMGLNNLPGESLCRIGQVVRSRRGKDVGRWYVVVGVSEDGRRIFLADGRNFTVAKPKPKNAAHLQRTKWHLDEIAQGILSKGRVDAGRFEALLSELIGMKSKEDEETACPTKAKSWK
ncbi:MAG: hypothetical protein ACOX5A_10705 [Aminivibrio sp.]|nr:hypothetical protein [Synergistaceae bacterium]